MANIFVARQSAVHCIKHAVALVFLLFSFFVGARALAAVSHPTTSPAFGVFDAPTSVTLSATAGATIYYTTDGSTPTPSSTQYTSPFTINSSKTVKAIAVLGPDTSDVASTYLEIDPNTSHVLRTGLLFWIKADNSVSTTGSNVTQWRDMITGNYATQSTSGNQPTYVANAVNGLPAVSFNGSSSFLNLPPNFDNLYTTCVFVVTKPTAVSPNARIMEFSVNAGTDDIFLSQPDNSGLTLTIFAGTTPSSLNSPSAVTLNQYQVLETSADGLDLGQILTNGTLKKQGSLPHGNFAFRTNNVLGSGLASSNFFQGEIAEILVYGANPIVTDAARKGVEGYLFNKYAIVGPAPTVTPASGVYPTPGGTLALPTKLIQPVTISSPDYNASFYYTLDGSTPTSSSTLYTAPFTVDNSAIVKSVAVRPYGTSDVSIPSYIQIDQSASSIARDGLVLWLKADYGVVNSGGAVSQWVDMSGSRLDATQDNSSKQPTVVVDAQNGMPVLKFNGTSQYLQLPTGFKTFAPGLTALVVANPMSASTGQLIELGNGSSGDNLRLSNTNTTPELTVYFINSGSSISASGSITLNKYQLLEGTQDGISTGTLKVNAQQVTSGSLNGPRNILRTQNTVGSNFDGSANFFQGGIAEVILYNRPLTASELSNAESYFLNRYQLLSTTPQAPVFSAAAGTQSAPLDLQITAPSNSTVYFTTDGSTPSSSSTAYTAPIRINYTQTVKAIAVKDGISSSVTEATYTLNATQWPKPKASDPGVLDFQIKLPSFGLPQ